MTRRSNSPKTPAAPPVQTKSPEELLLEKAIQLSGLSVEDFNALSDEEKAPHLEAAKTALEQEALSQAAQPPKETKSKLVKMTRDAEQYPDGPHEADVHPDEVENYQAGGFTVA